METQESMDQDEGTLDQGADESTASPSKERSTVRFPYGDLDDAIKVVTALKDNFGSACEASQLAGALRLSASSSGFRTKVATAVVFALVINKRGSISLTTLGHRVADEHTRADALVDAFLSVELYALVYEKFDGRALPGDRGLEAELRSFGVAEKQAERARRALQRSAETAGMFWSGRDRLVKPPMQGPTNGNGGAVAAPSEEPDPEPQTNVAVKPPVDALANPLLSALLAKMLPPEGEEFSARDRKRFFRALAVNLDVVYGEPTDGSLDAGALARLFVEADSAQAVSSNSAG